MAWLICGLGNPGEEYAHTRHNIGFDVIDTFCQTHGGVWTIARHGQVAGVKIKGRDIRLLKPATYMNLSGKALAYWMQQAKPALNQVLVICDDLALPAGKLRIRGKGSHGGQNGLRHIIETLGTEEFPRLRVGIGQDFPKGRQVEYVLGKWPEEQQEMLHETVQRATKAIESFVLAGLPETMTLFNR
jgi:peptidyl-tRNA hydrolase, PTH1 family